MADEDVMADEAEAEETETPEQKVSRLLTEAFEIIRHTDYETFKVHASAPGVNGVFWVAVTSEFKDLDRMVINAATRHIKKQKAEFNRMMMKAIGATPVR